MWPIIMMVWILIPLFLVLYAYPFCPKRDVLKKYSLSTLKRAKWPFGKNWSSGIDPIDIASFNAFRQKMRLVYIYWIITFPVILAVGIWYLIIAAKIQL